MTQVWISLAIFFIAYAVFVSDTFNRMLTAWIAAIVMVLFGIVNLEQLFTQYIEWQTILLMVSMMIFLGMVNRTNVFPYLAIRFIRLFQAKPMTIFVVLSLLAGMYAALLENVVAVLLLVPLTFSITRKMNVNPIPYLFGEMIAANLGGTLTATGSIPNMMIAGANPALTYLSFITYLGPFIALVFVVVILILGRFYRKELTNQSAQLANLEQIDVPIHREPAISLRNHLLIFGVTMIGLVCHEFIHLELSTIPICGALLLILFGAKKIDVNQAIEWIHLEAVLFMIAIYAIAGGIQHSGLLEKVATQILTFTEGHLLITSTVILWVSAIVSGALDNVLYISTVIPLLEHLEKGILFLSNAEQTHILWWSLVLGAGLGGNATLIASPVNLIVIGMALKQKQKVKFVDFLKIGIPISVVTLLLANGYVILRYAISYMF